MRMRLKKHLDERIAATQNVLVARESEKFYEMTDEQKAAFNLNLPAIFANDNPIKLEIGCGKGAFAIQSAQNNPDVNFLAVEKLSNVIVVACEQALPLNLNNLRFLNCRAENLCCFLPDNSISEILLNFSCPYPKKTYANRRLTSKNFLKIYQKLLVSGGKIRLKTDNEAFFDYSVESLTEFGFEVTDVCRNLPLDAEGNVVTEYEAKFRALGLPIFALVATIK